MVAALAMIPIVVVGIYVALPAFEESIAPFLLLLPGIVSLSVSKVLSGYVSGIGYPGRVGKVAVSSLLVNILANVLLIPSLGIAGAAIASTISYTFNACLMVVSTARLAMVRRRDLVIPTAADLRRLISAGGSLAARRFPV
jgi:Na+-driven multidrug efflux pump